MNRLAITRVSIQKTSYLAYIILDEKRNFVDFQLLEEEQSIINNIYIGRVENIVPNINSAFIRISEQQRGYLPLEDLKSPIFAKKLSEKKAISIGDEIVVQVVKDAIKTKEPVVSGKLALSGSYTMLTTDNTTLSISKKITGGKRQELQAILEEIKPLAETYDFGVILRTNSAQVSIEEVSNDLQSLIQTFIALKTQGIHKTAFALLAKEKASYIQKLKSLDMKRLDGIYTDEQDVYETIQKELPYLDSKEQKLLHFYNDTMVSLKTLYHIQGSIEELLKKKVWLKSGANIIIEQLETLTVIDVNSSKNIAKNHAMFCEINKEAAAEIAKQIRLRNISGMIIIDFINMKSEKEKREVIQVLKECFKQDPVLTNVIDVTKLGLVEVTRKKTYKSLKELLKSNGICYE